MPVGSCGCPVAFASALSQAPVGPFPPPALRTGRAGFRHPALQADHASRTRTVFPTTQGFLCAERGTRPAATLRFEKRANRPVYARSDNIDPSITRMRSLRVLHLRMWCRRTLRPDSDSRSCHCSEAFHPLITLPHLRPLPSTGITRCLQ